MSLIHCIFFLILTPCFLFAKTIETFYGPIEVEEPILLELIESKSFQRLKAIHQYGVSYYTTHKEEYTRYDHCLGVFVILRLKHASLEEQIAGLLHDVSHTVFSHVGDWIFGKHYHDSIHSNFMEKYGLSMILKKYGFTISQMMPIHFSMLEQPNPNLSADRIDYNIQGAYFQRFITKSEVDEIVADLRYINGKWVSSRPDLMVKLGRFSLFMTQNCWGSVTNYLSSMWLAEAILRAKDLGGLSNDDIHFGTDHEVWNFLISSKDQMIEKNMARVLCAESQYKIVDPSEADIIIKSKFRGINPWIISAEKMVRLTEIDPMFCQEYENVKKTVENGWPIKIVSYTQ